MFPGLRAETYEVTSPATPTYNCIAWAALDESHWWEPDAAGVYHWPEGAARAFTIEAHVEAFGQLGYERCSGPEPEDGFEKVVIYADAPGVPTHAARQLPDGTWTSKLGMSADIRHQTLSGVAGGPYGEPAVCLRRPSR